MYAIARIYAYVYKGNLNLLRYDIITPTAKCCGWLFFESLKKFLKVIDN